MAGTELWRFVVLVVVIVVCLTAFYWVCHYWLVVKAKPYKPPPILKDCDNSNRVRYSTKQSFITVYHETSEISRNGSVARQRSETVFSLAEKADDVTTTEDDDYDGSENTEDEQDLRSDVCAKHRSKRPGRVPSGTKSKADSSKDTEITQVIDAASKKETKEVKKPLTVEQVGCEILIGVHASASVFAGYFMDMKSKTCEFYAYEQRFLPWTVHRDAEEWALYEANKKGASVSGVSDEDMDVDVPAAYLAECNAKSAMFALCLWEGKLKDKKFKMYVTNEDSVSLSNTYGRRVRNLLKHLEKCEKAYRMNSIMVAREAFAGDGDKFNQFALPAVFLTKNWMKCFMDKINVDFGIERFDGTHEYCHEETDEKTSRTKTVYAATDCFENYLKIVKRKVADMMQSPCLKPSCGYSIHRTPSVQSIQLPSHVGDYEPKVVKANGPEGTETLKKGKPPASNTSTKSRLSSWKWMSRGRSQTGETRPSKFGSPSAPPRSSASSIRASSESVSSVE